MNQIRGMIAARSPGAKCHVTQASSRVGLAPETRGLIDARRVALIKPGALLIDVARAAIVDDDALRAERGSPERRHARCLVTVPHSG